MDEVTTTAAELKKSRGLKPVNLSVD
jgi:hypothetical protein